MQVVFSNQAFVSDRLDSSHIASVRELRHGVLQDLVPVDTRAFKWTDSAQISTTVEAWGSAALTLDPNFSIPGFRFVAANVSALRA